MGLVTSIQVVITNISKKSEVICMKNSNRLDTRSCVYCQDKEEVLLLLQPRSFYATLCFKRPQHVMFPNGRPPKH